MTVDNTAAAAAGASTGAAASTGGTLTLEAIQGLLTAAIAPLQAEITTLKNGHAAAQRVAKKEERKPAKTVDLSKIDDPELKAHLEEQAREVAAIREENAARAKRERETALAAALDTEIRNGKYANGDLMKGQLAHKLRFSTDDPNVVVVDDGTKAIPLSQAVKDLGMRDVFRPASVGNGAGAQGDQGAGGGQGAGAKTGFTAEQIAAMAPADVLKLAGQVQAGQAPAFAD